MKAFITYLVCLFWVLAPLASLRAITIAGFLAGAPPAAGGYVSKQSVVGASSGSYSVGIGTTTRDRATKFVASSTYRVTRVDLYLESVGSGATTFTVEIWSHDSGGDLPSAIVGTASASVAQSSIPAAETITSFYPSASLTSGTTYYVVCKCSGVDPSNYVLWHRNEVAGQVATYHAGTPAWSSTSTSRTLKYNIYNTE